MHIPAGHMYHFFDDQVFLFTRLQSERPILVTWGAFTESLRSENTNNGYSSIAMDIYGFGKLLFDIYQLRKTKATPELSFNSHKTTTNIPVW